MSPPPPTRLQIASNFLFGGMSSSTAACFTNPIDLVKVRQQLAGQAQWTGLAGPRLGFIAMFKTIARQEGARALWKGLTASVVRESTYSTLRMGLYEPFKRSIQALAPLVPVGPARAARSHESLQTKVLAGILAGSISAFICNPADLIKVRVQADVAGTRYANFRGAVRSIWTTEGRWRGMWKGVGPQTLRAGTLTGTQLPVYDHVKHMKLDMGIANEGPALHFCCSMVAGLTCALSTSPVDLVKSRYMNQSVAAPVYKSALDCVRLTFKHEGLRGFFKGFLGNWLRLGPHTLIGLLVFEQLRRLGGMAPI